jgi:hypothetical protein
MEMILDLELDDISRQFSSYNYILNNLPNFKQYLREIKLNTILQENKVQFDIDDITLYGKTGTNFENTGFDLNYLGIPENSFIIKSLSFVLKNEIVVKLSLRISPMGTNSGVDLGNWMSNQIPLKLKMYTISGHFHGSFYIEKSLD